MKKYIFLAMVVPFLGGCTSKIVTQKSPVNNLDNKHCFILPAKDYLATQSIGEQKLYELSEKALNENSFVVYHGEEKQECENYFYTSLSVSENDSFRTSRDGFFPGAYGYGGGIYRAGYIPVVNPVFMSSIDNTTRIKRFYTNYELHVGKKKEDNILTAWSGTEQKNSSSSTPEEATKIDDSDYPMVKKMVEAMLTGNELKSK